MTMTATTLLRAILITLAIIGIALALMGCASNEHRKVQYDNPIRVSNVLDEEGDVVGMSVDGQFVSADSIAMQTALFAQGLPVEPWYTKILPDLFGANVEEVRTGLMLYGVQMEAWRETIVHIEHPTVTLTDGTVLGGGKIRFPTSQPPGPPKFMSGLQRLGITGQQILTGFLAWMTIDLAKTSVNQPTPEPMIVRPEVITVAP